MSVGTGRVARLAACQHRGLIRLSCARQVQQLVWPKVMFPASARAPVLSLELGGLNQKRYGAAATQLMSTPTFAPLAFGISIETLGHVLRTLEWRC
jgi:hypothetical protein